MIQRDEIFKVLHIEDNSIDRKLEDPSSQLESFLDDESIITEFRGCNPRLLNRLKNDEFDQMIKFLIEEPSNEDDNKRKFRYPFISCELLTCTTPIISEQFFDRIPLFEADNSKMQLEEPQPTEETKQQESEEEDEDDVDMPPARCSMNRAQLNKIEQEEKMEIEQSNSDQEQKGENEITQENKTSQQQETKIIDQKILLQNKYQSIPRDNMYLIGLLLSLFDSNEQVNITLAGYVSKVFYHISTLAKTKNREAEISEYLFKNPNLTLNLTHHLHSKSCSEILVKVLSLPQSQSKSQQTTQNRLDTKLKIIDSVISQISSESTDFEGFLNIVSAISDTINTYTSYCDGKAVILHLISPNIFSQVLKNVVSLNSSISHQNATLLCSIVSLFNIIESRRSEEEDNQFKEYDIDFSVQLKQISEAIPTFISFLKDWKSQSEELIPTPYHATIQPLGAARLKIVELFCLLLKMDNFFIIQEIAQNNLHSVLLELLVAFEWNNMLHTFIERIIVQSAQINSHAMRKALFQDSKLMECLQECTHSTDSKYSSNGVVLRKGSLGHITKILNFLQKICDGNQETLAYIDQNAWKQVKEEFLIETNLNNDKNLGEHSIIDSDSPRQQLQCSYDIEDIKQRSEQFLFGSFQNSPTKEENFQNCRDAERQEEMEEFYFNHLSQDKKELPNSKPKLNDSFELIGHTVNADVPKNNPPKEIDPFDCFQGFDQQNQQQQQQQQQQAESDQNNQNLSFDDIVKSFGFSSSPSPVAKEENKKEDAFESFEKYNFADQGNKVQEEGQNIIPEGNFDSFQGQNPFPQSEVQNQLNKEEGVEMVKQENDSIEQNSSEQN